MGQKGYFGLFQATFENSNLPESDKHFYHKIILAKNLAQAKNFDPKFGNLGNFPISFTTKKNSLTLQELTQELKIQLGTNKGTKKI